MINTALMPSLNKVLLLTQTNININDKLFFMFGRRPFVGHGASTMVKLIQTTLLKIKYANNFAITTMIKF